MKEFEADTNASVIFALDSSASMDYGSKGVTKYDYGRFLIASLAWLSQQQGDRVGLATFKGDIVDIVPPSVRHLQLLLHTLGRSKATGAGSLATPVQRLAHMTRKSGITVLVTDCYESPEELGRCADSLRMRGQDLIIFHVVDAAERDFPFSAAATFEDSESKTRIAVRPDDLRKRYLEQAHAHHAAVAKRLVAVRRRLRARRYRPAAGPRAARVPRPPPRAEPGALMGFLVPAFLAGLAAHRRADRAAPQASRQGHAAPLPVADVRRAAADPHGATAPDHRLAPAAAAGARAIALLVLAFARPLWSRPGSHPLDRKAIARWSCCSTVRSAWATPESGRGRWTPREVRSPGSARPIASRWCSSTTRPRSRSRSRRTRTSRSPRSRTRRPARRGRASPPDSARRARSRPTRAPAPRRSTSCSSPTCSAADSRGSPASRSPLRCACGPWRSRRRRLRAPTRASP